MKVYQEEISFRTRGELDIRDITAEVEAVVRRSGVREGVCLVIVPGATGAVFLNEHDYSLLDDLRRVLRTMVPDEGPRGVGYSHPVNARSHLRAILLGNNQCIPVSGGGLVLGTWQQVMFMELDTRPRNRRVVVKVMGE